MKMKYIALASMLANATAYITRKEEMYYVGIHIWGAAGLLALEIERLLHDRRK